MHCVKRIGKGFAVWDGMVKTAKESRVKISELDKQEYFNNMQIALDHSEQQFLIRQRDGLKRGTNLTSFEPISLSD